ncbi:formate dehydrogenase [Seongchinamella sediminis]|uniref:Formate dehydrogenase n=1 Tax=Seongchinamella sediminis TaxID=2283635 RepID=A0A3L7DYW9_9GAMM|nr:formate dehydrogenase subunit delta [Seongchinamella sediminis]RLQ22798.1 formate dehydrogenase [Seongchinamella sediminis]
MTGQQIDRLVKMANQIALNFGEQRNLDEAARKTAEHLQKFWTPAMRRQLSAYAREGGDALSPAVSLLLERQRSQ